MYTLLTQLEPTKSSRRIPQHMKIAGYTWRCFSARHLTICLGSNFLTCRFYRVRAKEMIGVNMIEWYRVNESLYNVINTQRISAISIIGIIILSLKMCVRIYGGIELDRWRFMSSSSVRIPLFSFRENKSSLFASKMWC